MKKKMKAAWLTARGRIEIRETPVPEPGPGEVLVRLTHTGVCGSDVHYFREGRIGDMLVEYPFIIGHETAGRVETTGPGVTGFQPGDRVAVEPAANCGDCPVCRAGRPNLCPAVRFLGTPPVHGAFREYLAMPAECLYPLPAAVSNEVGALCEPLAVGFYALALARPEPVSAMAVFGCGPIGLSIIMSARAAGAGPIFAVEPLAPRRRLARRSGATAVFDPQRADPAAAILEATGGAGVPLVFEATGQAAALPPAIETAAIAGKVMLVGIPGTDWSFPPSGARRKELILHNVRRSAFVTGQVIELVATGRIKPAPMTTHRFPLEKVAAALELAGDYRDGVVKAMVEI